MQDTASASTTILIQHERTALGAPFAVKSWLALISHVSAQSAQVDVSRQYSIHERSLAALPTSYKLWKLYVEKAAAVAEQAHPSHPCRDFALEISLRAARALPHCPVLWEIAFGSHVREQRWSSVRGIVDEAIAALPVTLHSRFWRVVLKAVLEDGKFLQLGAHLLRRARMLKVGGDGAVELFRVLRDVGKIDEAVRVLSDALAVEGFGGDERRELWMDLISLATKHPGKCPSTNLPHLLRTAIARAEADVGELWAAMAGMHVRLAQFSVGKDVFEEALRSVSSVRDFAVVFDAYAKFLESVLTTNMDSESSEEDDESEDVESVEKAAKPLTHDASGIQVNTGADADSERDEADPQQRSPADSDDDDDDIPWEANTDALLADLESLSNRRALLLSDVCLRQNPHNVHEWHKRAGIFTKRDDLEGTVSVFTEAVRTVDPWRASHGRPHTLWLAFAQLYEKAGDMVSARTVLDKAVSDPEKFKSAADLAVVWCQYAEMEVRQGSLDAARAVLKRATLKPHGFDSRKFKRKDGRSKTKSGLALDSQGHVVSTISGVVGVSHIYDSSSPAWFYWKSLRVWSMSIDLLESLATPEEAFSAHEKMLELKIATVQTIVNGAAYLESRRLFELSFRLFDRATCSFEWPEAFQVWVIYLSKFVARYGTKKVERMRDLFEQAIKDAPPSRGSDNIVTPNEHLRSLFIMYARAEESAGLARHAMNVYSRAVLAVKGDQRASMYRLYVVRMCELFGISRARVVYEGALENLEKPEEIMEFAKRFAKMETCLGEVDRARAIFAHGAEVALPHGGAAFSAFWDSWNEFELEHGTEDTFQDMLRVKRRVQMVTAGVHLVTPAAVGAGTIEAAANDESERQKAVPDSAQGPPSNAMQALENQVLVAHANDKDGDVHSISSDAASEDAGAKAHNGKVVSRTSPPDEGSSPSHSSGKAENKDRPMETSHGDGGDAEESHASHEVLVEKEPVSADVKSSTSEGRRLEDSVDAPAKKRQRVEASEDVSRERIGARERMRRAGR